MGTSPHRGATSRVIRLDTKETDIRSLSEEHGSRPRSTCEWDKHTRPPANLCPQRYCFMWVPPRGAIGELPEVPEGRCGCEFGLCTRLDPVSGEGDFYEPCEPELEADDLPWFYFMAPAPLLASAFRKKYLRLARELWGEEPLEEPAPESRDHDDRT